MIDLLKHPTELVIGDRIIDRNKYGVELVMEIVSAGPKTDRNPGPAQRVMRFDDMNIELVLEGRIFRCR